MKKTLVVLLMVLLSAMLIISCDGNAESPVMHKVTFDSDNGSSAVVKEVKDGEKIAEPANPTKTGYSFQGWYDGDTKFEFTTAITKDYTLKAKWQLQSFTVSFNVNGGTGTYENQTINYGGKVDTSKVLDPTRTEASFLGWYNGSTKVDLANDTVTDNLSLTAKWGFTVSFNSDEGSSVQPQTVEENGIATKPDDPTKTGYTFGGWYEGDNEFVFTTPITKATTLKAKWNIATYTVTFNSDGGTPTSYDSKSVNYNQTIATEPTEPTKIGYTFGGWYNGNDKFEFGTTTVTGNIELKAKWNVQTFTVSFNANGGNKTVETQTVNYGEMLNANKIPGEYEIEKEGYTFIGWYEGNTKLDSNMLVTANHSFVAKWGYTVSFNTNGGTPVQTQKVEENGTATEPTNPSKNGCMFNKWTTDQAGNNEYDFNSSVTGNIILYAQWTTFTVGGTVNLGKYPTGYDVTSLINQPITWKVLSVDTTNSRALVISEKVLENRAFGSSPYYYEASIRGYLNGDFITKYGLDSSIIENVDATSETTAIGGGNDKVFLLSEDEATDMSYFAISTNRVAYSTSGSASGWWLRSTDGDQVSSVDSNGFIINVLESGNNCGLRPAMWVNL